MLICPVSKSMSSANVMWVSSFVFNIHFFLTSILPSYRQVTAAVRAKSMTRCERHAPYLPRFCGLDNTPRGSLRLQPRGALVRRREDPRCGTSCLSRIRRLARERALHPGTVIVCFGEPLLSLLVYVLIHVFICLLVAQVFPKEKSRFALKRQGHCTPR